MPKKRHTVTAQLSPALYAKVQEMHDDFPGCSLHKLMLACIALATEADREVIKTYLKGSGPDAATIRDDV